MADMNEIYDALRKANAAGDKDSVVKLSNYINSPSKLFKKDYTPERTSALSTSMPLTSAEADQTGAPMSVRAAVGAAQTPSAALKTLQKYDPNAYSTPDGGFVFRNRDTGKPTAYNPSGLDGGDIPSVGREIAQGVGGTLGFIAASPTALSGAGPVIGAGLGGGMGGQVYDKFAKYFLGTEDDRSFTETLKGAGTDVAVDAAGAVVGPYVANVAARAIGSAARGVTGPFGRNARAASEALRGRTASSVSAASDTAENDVLSALNEAKRIRATPPSSPALEARRAQYVLNKNEASANRTGAETAKKQAAALQAMEDKRVIQPIGEPATREAIGAAPQAEMLGAKAAREKAASEAWTEASIAVDAIDASKQGFGTRIAYTKPFKDFIASAKKEANASVGNPQTKAFYSKILEWFPEDNINAIKPSHLLELKRFIAETAFDPASGFKAIAKERSKNLYGQLDNILNKHLTDPKTGATPYKDGNDAYALYKKAWEKDYLSKYGKKFTAENISGDAVSSGTDVSRALFGDPAAMRAAIADGASIPTLLKSSASHVANEFEGKSVDEIVKLLNPKTPLSNTLENVPELAPLRESVKKYVQEIMDQQQAGIKISGFSNTEDDFAKAAAQSEKAAVTAQDRLVKGTETRRAQLTRQVDKEMDTATTRQKALIDLQELSGDLSSARIRNNPEEIIKIAKLHFKGDQAMLDEIAKIEKMNISAEGKRKVLIEMAKWAAGGGVAATVGAAVGGRVLNAYGY